MQLSHVSLSQAEKYLTLKAVLCTHLLKVRLAGFLLGLWCLCTWFSFGRPMSSAKLMHLPLCCTVSPKAHWKCWPEAHQHFLGTAHWANCVLYHTQGERKLCLSANIAPFLKTNRTCLSDASKWSQRVFFWGGGGTGVFLQHQNWKRMPKILLLCIPRTFCCKCQIEYAVICRPIWRKWMTLCPQIIGVAHPSKW